MKNKKLYPTPMEKHALRKASIRNLVVALVCLSFTSLLNDLNAQVRLRVRIVSGTSATTCTDGAFGGPPEPQWRVKIANQTAITYPMTGSCFTNPPYTQYDETYDCPSNYPSSLQVCFDAFEDDGANCIVSASCLQSVCQNYTTPAPGDSSTFTLSIPSGTSTGSVTFTLYATGSWNYVGTDTRTECNSYTWIDGNTYTSSNNTATHTLLGAAANGCDSTVNLDLTIVQSATGTDTRTECNSYMWIDGNHYTSSNNTATHTIVGGAANGCDSLVSLNLTIVNSATGTDTRTECNSYLWIDGNNYTSSNNTATHTIVGGAANGCDSLVSLNLTIVNSATGTDTRTECNSYTWIDGNNYTASNNTATHTIFGGAANGCDSLVSLNLTIVNSATGTDTRTECNSYTWIDGNNYTASNNTATHTIVGGAANGCDSVVSLDLTINRVSDLSTSVSGITITANNTAATYRWLDCDDSNSVIPSETGQTFTAKRDGHYAVELTENGCVDTSECVTIFTVGILENSFGPDLLIYPNPTTGNFSLDLGAVYENSHVSINDIAGKLIASKTMTQSQILNLSIQEPSGVYIITVQAGGKKAIIRLVKQ
ncbi:MAG: T9SS type A sorting domain-containing protein [Bacteroidetes bacterium]|nr:MAG: T9SS type A sorting domain-containing protein [Bacteroidota bacterium]